MSVFGVFDSPLFFQHTVCLYTVCQLHGYLLTRCRDGVQVVLDEPGPPTNRKRGHPPPPPTHKTHTLARGARTFAYKDSPQAQPALRQCQTIPGP